MNSKLLVCFAGVCFFFTICESDKRVFSFAGRYKTYAEKIYQCPANKPTDKIGIFMRPRHLSHPKALQKISGNITLHVPFADWQWIMVNLAVWNNNQWKENAFIFKFPRKACAALRSNAPDFFQVFFKKDPYAKEPCEVPVGVYVVEDHPVNWTFPNFPVMPYGTYRFHLTLGVDKETYGCTMIENKVVPLTD